MKNYLAKELERVNKLIEMCNQYNEEWFGLLKENFLYYHKRVLYNLYKIQHLAKEYEREKEELLTYKRDISDDTMDNIETIQCEILKYHNFCKFRVNECERKLFYTTPNTTTNDFINLEEKIKIEVLQDIRKYYNIRITQSSKYIL